MLVGYPAKRNDDCHKALLVDSATGVARVLAPDEVAQRMKIMQLAGAVEGTCPSR